MIIGAAWLKEKNGEKYFYARVDLPLLGSLSFVIRKKHEKKGNQPDYEIIWYPEKKHAVVNAEQEDEEVPF